MDGFTFVVFTYNQADYVIEHLESIKYQILRYGKDLKLHFLLCDDASTDDTVSLVREWLKTNRTLFQYIKLLTPNKNRGIVRNYESALRNIDTLKFKILAGDDLYFKNDIFKASEKSNMVLSPVISFCGEEILPNDKRWDFKRFIRNQDKDLKRYIFELLGYGTPIETPGVFFDSSTITDELFRALTDYCWIEDVPLYNCLLQSNKTEVSLNMAPLTLYRTDSGISNNTDHPRNKVYESERERLFRTIHTKFSKYPKYWNPYCYIDAVKVRAYIHYYNRKDRDICSFNSLIAKEESTAGQYLCYIRKRAEEWKQKTGI